MTNKDLANLMFPSIKHDTDFYENKYKDRNLKEGAIVTRYAPSPTGFVHMGALYASFIASHMAHQTDGVMFLRIEDTDQERKVENGVVSIIKDLNDFGIAFDEGMTSEDDEIGEYGPYTQSKRKEIYQTYVKSLVEKGLAYPCFCTKEELDKIREDQAKIKTRIGYYGNWAKYRNLSIDEAITRIKNGEEYVVRLKSPGDFNRKIRVKDCIRGVIEFPEHDIDDVILKRDGLPTYHFAHAIDDHLMHTTHVIRGDEWVSSLPLHIQLFQVLGFKAPKYAHISPLEKIDGDVRRKLSKRKDPEAAVSYYAKQGIPKEAVMIYLATVSNSNFERWFETNPKASLNDFKMEFNKMSKSGSLFDLEKLLNISKNYISKLPATKVYDDALTWASEYDDELKDLLVKYKEYSTNIFNIERERKKPRKDYNSYSDIKNQIWYMFDELYNPNDEDYEFGKINDYDEIKTILDEYINNYYNEEDDESTWFNRMKELCDKLGYASDMKQYKEDPSKFKGNVADVSIVLRVALTTKAMTPNLYDIMKLLGYNRIKDRYNKFITQ